MDRADKVIAFVNRYIRVPEGSLVGHPLHLEAFQEKFIRDIYANPKGTRRAILSLARKNGKTALIACLILAHLVGPEAKPNSQIASGAMSREQAALVFDLACKMIRLSPELSEIIRIVPSGKRLIGLPRNVEYKALAAEGKTAHGLSISLAIIDEAGQVRGPQDDFIDAITTSQGAHEHPLLIVISTQAATDADLLSVWIDDALASDDPHTVCHLHAASPEADIMDPEGWKAANPALGIFRSLKDVEEQAKQAVRMPSAQATFQNLVLNQRVNTVAPFVSKSVWDSCSDEPAPMQGQVAWGGLDLSARTDLTSFVLVYETPGEEGLSVKALFFAPEKGVVERSKRDRVPYDLWAKQGWLTLTPGATVDYEYVARTVADLLDEVDIQAIAYDRWRIDIMRKELEELGLDLPLVEHGQGFKDMSPALDSLEADLLNARLRHGNNPILTMCAANAVSSQDPAGNRKLDKSKANGRIDGMVALAMAIAVADKTQDAGPSVYEERGLISV